MNWSKGYTSAVYVREVDRSTWRDLDRIEIYGGSVDRSAGDLQQSASLQCVDFAQDREIWVRVWMDVNQEGAADHVALFTGLATSPTRDINGRLFTNSVECYSVLKPAADVLLPRGWYAAAGASGADLVAELLAATPAPKAVAGSSPALATSYVAESGESNLTMAGKILTAIGWRTRITGDGTIYIEPQPEEAAVSFDCLEADAVEPVLSATYDWYTCPNVLRATRSGVSAVAVDDDPNSIFSTINRGREIWAEEKSVTLSNRETLESYATRRLKELQKAIYSVSYSRRYHPDLYVGDLVRLHYPEQRVDGIYRITSQSIDLAKGGRTQEEGEQHES